MNIMRRDGDGEAARAANGPRQVAAERNATTSKWVYPLLVLAFATWVVSLAGIASLQADCNTADFTELYAVRGFSSTLGCSNLFRFYWFIVALQGFLVFALAIALATGLIARTRMGWIAWFTVATLLYILMADTFLTARSLAAFSGGQLKNRMRTMAAGAIMTAIADMLLLMALGSKLLRPKNNAAGTGYGGVAGTSQYPGATDKNTGGMVV